MNNNERCTWDGIDICQFEQFLQAQADSLTFRPPWSTEQTSDLHQENYLPPRSHWVPGKQTMFTGSGLVMELLISPVSRPSPSVCVRRSHSIHSQLPGHIHSSLIMLPTTRIHYFGLIANSLWMTLKGEPGLHRDIVFLHLPLLPSPSVSCSLCGSLSSDWVCSKWSGNARFCWPLQLQALSQWDSRHFGQQSYHAIHNPPLYSVLLTADR